jgi:hypothetical protein
MMQFSLRAFLIFVGLFSAYCGLTFALPVALSTLGLTLLTFLFPPIIVGGIIYSRGTLRAFWIGCAASGFIPLIVALYLGVSITIATFGDWGDLEEGGRWYCAGLAFCHVLVAVYGVIVVAMRWFSRGFGPTETKGEAPASSVIHRRVIIDEPAVDDGTDMRVEEERIG